MKTLLITSLAALSGLGWYASRDVPAQTPQPPTTPPSCSAQGCTVEAHCTPAGTCVITCHGEDGRTCTIELACSEEGCDVVRCEGSGCAPCPR